MDRGEMKKLIPFATYFRAGVVKPCRVGDDGKPYAVDHILQLRNDGTAAIQNQDSD